MGHHQHSAPFLSQLLHHSQDFTGQLGVQSRGGLIKIDDLRVSGQCPGNGHPLLLPTGQLPGVRSGTVCQADLFQQGQTGLLRLLFRHLAGNDQPLGHVLQGGLIAEQIVVLEHKGGLAAQSGNIFVGKVGQVKALAVKAERTAVCCFQKVCAAQQGGLAGAAGPQNGNDVAFFYREADILQDRSAPKDLRMCSISSIGIGCRPPYSKPRALSQRSSKLCSLVMTVQNSRYTTATSQ